MSKKKKSSGSKSGFNAKEFFIMHVEKIVFAFIAMIAGLVMYLGFSEKPFPVAKTPEKLQTQATQVSRDLKLDHNAEVFKDPERKVSAIYYDTAQKERQPKDPVIYRAVPVGSATKANVRARRGDPALAAPEQLEATYFIGSVAMLTARPDALDALEDAKKPEGKKPKQSAGAGPGGSGGGSFVEGGGGEGSSSGGMGGPGGGMMGGDPLIAGQRRLSPGYDLGFRMGMRTFPDLTGGTTFGEGNGPVKTEVAPRKPVAYTMGFVCVTALAPHEIMEDQYKKEFFEVRGYTEGRDTPNYVGFEAQRAEITDRNKVLAESDWQPLPQASPTEFKERLKRMQGTCSEVHMQDWVEPNISMPIPPVLLSDYRKIGIHSKVPSNIPDEVEGGVGMGMGMGMGMGSGGGGFTEGNGGEGSDGLGMGSGGSGAMGFSGSGGMGSSGSGGMGYSGSGGMGSSGSGGMGYSGSGGMGMGGPGGRGGSGGGSSFGGDEGGGATNLVMEAPKKLPSTKHKLVRFYDLTAQPGKIYRYRVRLLMYDPNYPEWEFLKPVSSTLAVDTLKRVQKLQSEEPKPTVSKDQTQPAVAAKRKSRRETEWSAPSEPILTVKPAAVYIAKDEKVECVFVDFADYDKNQKDRGVYVPRKENLERGLVFGTPAKVKGKEAPIDIIHPIKKVIKALKDFRSSNLVTVIDLKGYAPLQMGNASKDPIRAGIEAVSFDPLTGQLAISREFDNFGEFYMFTQPDMPAIGPLGGGLSGGAAGGLGGGSSSGGEDGMGMGGDMGPGGMGAGGMSPGGMGSGGMGPGGRGGRGK